MNRWFRRLHDRQEPAGIEAKILKKMPGALLAGTVIPLMVSIIARIQLPGTPGIDVAKQITTIDIFVFATLVTFWTAALTLSIGCIVVYLMKGPAYVADEYVLDDAPRPPADTGD